MVLRIGKFRMTMASRITGASTGVGKRAICGTATQALAKVGMYWALGGSSMASMSNMNFSGARFSATLGDMDDPA